MNRTKRAIVTWLSVALIMNTMPFQVCANEMDEIRMPELTEVSEILEVEENTTVGEPLADDNVIQGAQEDDDESIMERVGNGAINWSELQSELDAAGTDPLEPTEIKLVADIEPNDNQNCLTISENTHVKLDLDGHTIDRKLADEDPQDDGCVIKVGKNASLTIFDQSESKTGKITGGNSTGEGGGVYVCEDATFTMEDGIIIGNYADWGGGVYVCEGADFTMEGGTVSGNSANGGGGVYIYEHGTFDMEGGILCQNRAYNSKYNNGAGGGVYLNTGASFTINDGAINNNTADTYGGGVFIYPGSEFTMTGGEIIGNTLINPDVQQGGGVFIGGDMYAESSKFTMSGGRICRNSAYQGGGVVVTSDSTFTMTGGLISGNSVTEGDHPAEGGGVYVYGGTFNVSGSPVIKGNTKGGNANNIEYDEKINVTGKLTDTAELRVQGEENDEIAQGSGHTLTADDAAKFLSDDDRYIGKLNENENKVVFGKRNIWAELQTLLDNASTTPENPTKIRLNWDATAGEGDAGLVVKNGTYVEIDLNGHTIDRGLANVSSKNNGYVIIVNDKASLSVNDSSDAQEGRITGGNTTGEGGGVYVEGGTFSLKGGSISGNKAEIKGGGVYVGYNGNFRMEGGSIIGNTAKDGAGGVYVNSRGTLAMEGGSISGNTSYDNGGGVYVNDDGTFSMSGNAVLNRNTASSNGGGVYVRGSLTMSDNAVLNGNTTHASGGGVYVYGGTLTMEGGSITGNTAAYGNGGGAYVENGTLSMNGGNITGNDAAEFGGGVYVEKGTLSMKGGSITGNKAASSGGGVYVRTDTFSNTGGNFELSGNPVISGNVIGGSIVNGLLSGGKANNVYFLSENKIRIIGEMTNTIPVGVTVEPAPEGDEKIDFTTNWKTYMNEDSPVGYFSSDDRGCSVIYNKTTDHGEAALTGHIHNFTYTANGATITATCSNSDGKCPLEDHRASITVNAPEEGLTYDGTAKPAAITGDTAILGTPEISYKEGGRSLGNDAPVDAGSFTASITLEGETASVSYTISPKQVTLSGVSVKDKIYDGNTDAEVTGTPSINGILEGDKGKVSVVSGNAIFTDPDAGNDKKVQCSGWKLTGERASNYDLVQPENVTGNIKKAAHGNETASTVLKVGMSGMFDLDPWIEKGGKADIAETSDHDGILSGTPTVSDNHLKWAFVDDKEKMGKSATVRVVVNDSVNYNSYELAVTLTVIECTHLVTETRHYKEATCNEQGYTGDVCCAECNAVLHQGESLPIDPNNHDLDYDNGTIKAQATTLVMGTHTYTCKRCGAEKDVQDIPVVPAANGRDYDDFAEDTKSGTVAGDPEGTVKVGDVEVSKIEKDEKGNITSVKTEIWIGGLKASYPYTGAAIKPEFHVYDGINKLTAKKDYSVSFKNNKDAGSTATITVKLKGNYNTKATKELKTSFKIEAAVLGSDALVSDKAILYNGKSQAPTPDIIWKATGKKINWKGFVYEYYKIDAEDTKLDKIKDVGSYKVIVKPKKNNGNFTGSAEAVITIAGKNDKNRLMSKASITFKPNKYTYTGNAIVPAPDKYTVKLGGKVVSENAYTVEFSNNTEPGKAKAVFTAIPGRGYYGSKTVTFTITGGKQLKKNGEDGFTYSYIDSLPYTKGGVKPGVTISDNGITLEAGRDYTVSYKYNKAVAAKDLKNKSKKLIAPQIIVKGKGRYKGNVILPFEITAQDISRFTEDLGAGSISAADKVVTKAKNGYMKPTLKITDFDGKKLKAGTDYEIVSYTVMDKDRNVIGTSAPKDKNPVAAGAGYIIKANIRAKGKNYTGTAEAEYRYIAKGSDLGKVRAGKLSGKTYTGYEITLTDTDLTDKLYIMEKGTKKYLVPGTDFEVLSYSSNVKKGTAKVTLVGKAPNYGGTKTLSFKITVKTGDCKGALIDGEWK